MKNKIKIILILISISIFGCSSPTNPIDKPIEKQDPFVRDATRVEIKIYDQIKSDNISNDEYDTETSHVIGMFQYDDWGNDYRLVSKCDGIVEIYKNVDKYMISVNIMSEELVVEFVGEIKYVYPTQEMIQDELMRGKKFVAFDEGDEWRINLLKSDKYDKIMYTIDYNYVNDNNNKSLILIQ